MAAQNRFRLDNKDVSSVTYGNRCNNAWQVQLSLVAMFTTGAADRNGLRLGAGISLSQTIGKWTLSAGADVYKAKQRFGLGTTFAGGGYDSQRFGGTYYLNKYWQGDKQLSGMIRARLFEDLEINFEDDILAYPFAGFKVYDRYRTAALELRYRKFMIGTNVYTTDMDGITDYSPTNSKGQYRTGKQISSPVYAGYATNGLIVRYGWNGNRGGLLGQNLWHRYAFDTPDFGEGGYSDHFLQIGIDKPYTLY